MEKDKKDFKKIIGNIFNKIKVFVTKNIKIISIIITVIIVVSLILLIVFKRRAEKFALNEIYDVYPEEVRALYANMVSVSCGGDWHLDINTDGGVRSITNLDKKNLVDYLFSYLDKQGALEDTINMNVFEAAQKTLLDGDISLEDVINKYQYGDYQYTVVKRNIVRTKKGECKNDPKMVLHLYGYFWKDNKLSMDVNTAYLKDGVLYNYKDQKLGEYDGDVSKLQSLTENTSYYRFNFIKDGGKYKLTSVEWKNRT